MPAVDRSPLDQLHDRLAGFFAAQPDVTSAYLFGSTARGQAGPLSDVDVAVLLDDQDVAPGERARREDRLQAGLAALLRRDDVDLIPLDRAAPLLKHRIVRDGRLLHARDAREAGGFAARAVLEYLDTAPLRRAAEAALERRLAADLFGRPIPYRTPQV